MNFVSRAGEKLEFAINHFSINPKGFICADFGSSTGGFTDCLLQHEVKRVYAIDTAYGELDWNLRNDKRVVVMEKTNAMFATLPEKVDLIVIDTGWTRQEKILPNAIANLKPKGTIISLIKPHYEAPQKYLRKGKLMEEKLDEVLGKVRSDMLRFGLSIIDTLESPVLGDKGKNKEFVTLLNFTGSDPKRAK